jgi:hypothetical protein
MFDVFWTMILGIVKVVILLITIGKEILKMRRRTFQRWTVEQVEYLKNNYGVIMARDIGTHLGFTERKVIGKAYTLGLKSSIVKRSDTIESLIRQSGHIVLDSFKSIKDKVRFLCKYCGNEFTTTPSRIGSGHTKSCGCVSIGKRKGTKHICMTYYSHCLQSARVRNIEFILDIDFLNDLIEGQNFKCVLSGQTLICGYRPLVEYTISLDRIDSSKGYTKDNVQFIHKVINMCKQSLSQKDFIEMCSMVSNHSST